MRVQLSEKSKAEFIELIAKDSITCWFEGDEFVMPSGQGKTAKGIVLGKLLVWQHQQSKVDELQEEFAEDERFLKEKIDQKEQQIVELKYLQSMDKEFIHALRNKSDELQKRIDGIKKIIREAYESDGNSSVEIVFDEVEQLEQALKGGEP